MTDIFFFKQCNHQTPSHASLKGFLLPSTNKWLHKFFNCPTKPLGVEVHLETRDEALLSIIESPSSVRNYHLVLPQVEFLQDVLFAMNNYQKENEFRVEFPIYNGVQFRNLDEKSCRGIGAYGYDVRYDHTAGLMADTTRELLIMKPRFTMSTDVDLMIRVPWPESLLSWRKEVGLVHWSM